MDSALSRSAAPHDLTVYRGVQLDRIAGLPARELLKPGMELSDNAFTSTSMHPGEAFAGDRLEIRVPKGTPAPSSRR